MKINVPFLENKANDCGPTALQMVLNYFGKEVSLQKIQQAAEIEASGITWTIGLAKAAAELGCKVEFFTTKLGAVHDNAYYKEHADMNNAQEKLKALAGQCRALGVGIKEEKLPLMIF